MRGLAKITAELFPGKQLCKKEQISNWTKRPLRKTQLHYGALDAYILVEIMEILAEKGKEMVREAEDPFAVLAYTSVKKAVVRHDFEKAVNHAKFASDF